MAIARRQGFGKHILLADFNEALLGAARKQLEEASYQVSALKVDVSSRESVRALADKAAALGSVANVVNTEGVSPNMAPLERVLAVDLYGCAVVFEEFEGVIAEGGSGLVVSSMAGYMSPALPKEQDHALAFTPADKLLNLPFLGPDAVPNSMMA
jgi:NAD(P)-dependent dehydrogenase (short-subunit alcohol dehydrogenase family)